MIRLLVIVFVVCLVVFLIEKFGDPHEPWRTAFRLIALAVAVVALIIFLLGMPL